MITWLLDSLFPRRCVGCGKEGSWICHNCQEGVGRDGWPREVSPGIWALLPYRESVVREAMHALKYHGIFELAEKMVAMGWTDSLFDHLGLSCPVLIPVPTSFARQKVRGYNQAVLIAQAISRRTGWELRTDVLVKTARGSMIGKSREQRQEGAGYALRKRAAVPLGEVLLIDDLCTTGSTLTACRKALGREVPALTVAWEELV